MDFVLIRYGRKQASSAEGVLPLDEKLELSEFFMDESSKSSEDVMSQTLQEAGNGIEEEDKPFFREGVSLQISQEGGPGELEDIDFKAAGKNGYRLIDEAPLSQAKQTFNFISLGYRLIQIYSKTHHAQDTLKLGSGGAFWQLLYEAGTRWGAGYVIGQCFLPGVGAMLGINLALLVSQKLMSMHYGDIALSAKAFKTTLLELAFSVPPADALWEPAWDLAVKATESTGVLETFLLAAIIYYGPAFCFSALQNLADSVARQCGSTGFFSDAKFTTKVMATYTAFGATENLSGLLQSVFGESTGAQIAVNIFAAGVTTAAGSGFVSVAQHLDNMKEVGKCTGAIFSGIRTQDNQNSIDVRDYEELNKLMSSGTLYNTLHASTSYPTKVISALPKLVYSGLGMCSSLFASSKSKMSSTNVPLLQDAQVAEGSNYSGVMIASGKSMK